MEELFDTVVEHVRWVVVWDVAFEEKVVDVLLLNDAWSE